MIQRSIVTNRLWWKELRQLLPLVGMLVGSGLFLHLILLFSRKSDQQVGQLAVFVGMPGLFAVGAGALLIGQEKELHTLGWLSSLPVRKQALVRVKLLVCLLGLIAIWLFSWLMLVLLTAGDTFRSPVASGLFPLGRQFDALTWPLHSLFVLLCGIAIAWRFRSSLQGLLLLIPVAMLPAIAANLFKLAARANGGAYSLEPSWQTLVAFQLAGCVAALWYGWKHAVRTLSPARAARPKIANSGPLGRKWSAPDRLPYPPSSALLWQSLQQNKSVYLGCLALAAAAIALFATTISNTGPNGWELLAAIMAYAAVSWLGVSTFSADRLYDRVRFLAERGVSSRRTWLTRQALPASLVVTACLAAIWVTWLALPSVRQSSAYTSMLLGVLLVLGLVFYNISQWVGQLVTSPIVAVVAAPIMSLAACAFGIFAFESLGAPIWLLLICASIPLIVTYVLNKNWMEGKFGRRFWSTQAVAIAAVLVVPAIPFAYVWSTTPGMSSETRSALQAELGAWSGQYGMSKPTEIVLASAPTKVPVPVSKQASIMVNSLQDQLIESTGPIQVSRRVVDFLCFQLQMTRLRLAPSGTSSIAPEALTGQDISTTEDEQRRATMRERAKIIELAGQIISRLRESLRLVDQDTADRLEIGLLIELRMLPDIEWSGVRVDPTVYRQLGDRAGRRRARQRAVAVSWWNFDASLRSGGMQLGGYPVEANVNTNLERFVLHRRRVERAIEDLWEFADANAQESEGIRRRLAEFWPVPRQFYGLGPIGEYFRADDVDSWLPELPSEYRFAPASQWQAGWETQAAKFAEEQLTQFTQ